jgi:excisionase family DNA binding protein
MTDDIPVVLRPAQAAAHLGVSYQSIRRWAEKGLIKVQWTAGGQFRVPMSEVERIKAGPKGRDGRPKSSALRDVVTDPAVLSAREIERARARGREIAIRANEQEERRRQAGLSTPLAGMRARLNSPTTPRPSSARGIPRKGAPKL